MALTVTVTESSKKSGGRRCRRATVKFDASYPTGGEAVTAADFALDSRIVDLHPRAVAGYIPVFNAATSKIMVYWADNDAEADSALVEVADTTDLSAVTIVCDVEGD
jgi:hypothetical protein